MNTRRKPPPRPPLRSARADGTETRAQILQAAGRLFAEHGYERTTSRDVCIEAGSHMAAVNYHFGGKDGLYEAVLVAAHGHLVQLDDLEAIVRAGAAPPQQLRAVIDLFLQRPPDATAPWALRVLLREFMAPSRHAPALLQQAVLPKIALMRALVASLLGVDAAHPAAQRALAFVVMPCIMLVIAPREMLGRALPALAQEPRALAEEMSGYALAGLAAMAESLRSPP